MRLPPRSYSKPRSRPTRIAGLDSISALHHLALTSELTDFASLAGSVAAQIRATPDSMTDEAARREFTRAIEQLRAALDHPSEDRSEAVSNNLAEDPELIRDFVTESREHLEIIESQVLTLEKDASNLEAIHSVFRSFHTIKGLAGFLEFEVIQRLAHEVETLLDLARNEKLAITETVIDVILESKDFLSRCLRALDSFVNGDAIRLPDADTALLSRIDSLIHSKGVGAETHANHTAETSSPGEAVVASSRCAAGENSFPIRQSRYGQARLSGRHGRRNGDRAVAGSS